MNNPEDRIRLRITIVGLVVLSMFGILVARLWFLQVLAGDSFAREAERNHVRLLVVEAPRGRILDRDGTVLVKNRVALAVGIRRDDLPDDTRAARAVKARLARLLDVSVAEIDRKLADRRTSPYKPTVIASDVSREVVFTIRERQERYPGVETLSLPVRTYPQGSHAAHILGYVGETTDEELARLKGYRLGDHIGRTGVERTHEKYLRGTPGLEKLEVDAVGRVIRSLGERSPVPGADLYLTIDLDIQRAAEEALEQGIRRARSQTFRGDRRRFKAPAGAAVVLDAQTGEVVAMASNPTFNPRRFVGGVDDRYWQSLNDPDNHYPLLNRAIQAAYPPGSTFKPIVATAALATGTAGPGSQYPCLTGYRFGDRVFRNWRPRNASITVAQSLIESCDTVYYVLARNWWAREVAAEDDGKKPEEVIQRWARAFGLDAPTGIDLPQETAGRVPDRAWRRSAWEANREQYCDRARKTGEALFEDLCERGYLWRGGDALNMSIGQGDVLATPLQMATMYAAVANGGKVLQPHVAARAVAPDGGVKKKFAPKVRSRVKASKSDFDYVRRALRGVSTRGTAQFPFRSWPHERIPVASKTGSAEIAGKQPYSWFAAFAPADDPKYVVVSVVEEAGSGSQVSGPVVRRIMDELFGLDPLPIVFGTRSD